jgi:uncharacterized protein (TIGR03067 family)
MFAFKLKAATAAILVVCTLGLGAWTAGAGDDPGIKNAPEKVLAAQVPAKEAVLDVSKIRSEMTVIEQELIDLLIESKAAGGNPPESVKRRIQRAEEKLSEFRRFMAEARYQQTTQPKEPLTTLEPGLRDLQGKWKIESIKDGKTVQPMDPKVEFVIEIAGNKFFMPYRESDGTVKQKEYRVTVDAAKNPKAISLIQPGKPTGHGIYEFSAVATSCVKCHAAAFDLKKDVKDVRDLVAVCGPGIKISSSLRLAIAMNAPQPTKFGGTEGALEFQLIRVGDEHHYALPQQLDRSTEALRLYAEAIRLSEAQAVAEEARAKLAVAQIQAAQAKAQFEVAMKQLDEARARIAALEKLAEAHKPSQATVKDDAAYTVHIRTLYAPEKVIRVKTTGSQSVLEGLAYAAEDMAIKPETITVWVLREKGLLSVDLAAITQKGDTKTNYQLKPGDQLFVQVKIGK